MNIDFITALFIVFLVLKLAGVIAWSWWWVFAPLWLPIVFVVSTLLVAFLLLWIAEKYELW